jgi:hypothetical protein
MVVGRIIIKFIYFSGGNQSVCGDLDDYYYYYSVSVLLSLKTVRVATRSSHCFCYKSCNYRLSDCYHCTPANCDAKTKHAYPSSVGFDATYATLSKHQGRFCHSLLNSIFSSSLTASVPDVLGILQCKWDWSRFGS